MNFLDEVKMIEVKNCLICKSPNSRLFKACKDYTVSNDIFSIRECSNCGFKFTAPRPPDNELGNYYKSEEYISHSDTKKGFVNRLYHLVRNYTLVKKMQLLHRFNPRQGNVLDYGCGTGAFLNICKSNNWKTFGVEPDESARNIANNNYGLSVFSNIIEASKKIEVGQIDVITLWHVLEHVAEVDQLMKFIVEKLNGKGTLIIALPNPDSFDARYYGEVWAAYDVPRHLYHFKPKDIKALLEFYGFRLEKSLPMVFDSFYVSMLSEKYKHGKINFLKAFSLGCYSNILALKSGLKYSSQIYIFKKA